MRLVFGLVMLLRLVWGAAEGDVTLAIPDTSQTLCYADEETPATCPEVVASVYDKTAFISWQAPAIATTAMIWSALR